MLSTIASSPLLATATHRFAAPCLNFIKTVAGSDKIQALAARLIQGCSSLYLSSYGTFELSKSRSTSEATKADSVGTAVLAPSQSYLTAHGGCLLSSGLCYLTDLLNKLGIIARPELSSLLCTVGNVAFLCANICALDENLRMYTLITETDWTNTNIDPRELQWLKKSTCWGIVSNVGYIIAMCSVLFGHVTAITLLIAILACLAGGMKILYDVKNMLAKR